MTTLSLSQSTTAVTVNIPASFQGVGGTRPYTYSVIAGGAGGTINARTGAYLAPNVLSSSIDRAFDTVQVLDSTSPTPQTATAIILVGTPLLLFCDIIEVGMGLPAGSAWVWDQKIYIPGDYALYVAVSVPMVKPFGNSIKYVPTSNGLQALQSVNCMATLDIDLISRGPAARDQKELFVLALNSQYAEQQMNINSFYIGKLPPKSRFINLSTIDGAAIPYRYRISVQMQYAVSITKQAQYYSQFSPALIYTNT